MFVCNFIAFRLRFLVFLQVSNHHCSQFVVVVLTSDEFTVYSVPLPQKIGLG